MSWGRSSSGPAKALSVGDANLDVTMQLLLQAGLRVPSHVKQGTQPGTQLVLATFVAPARHPLKSCLYWWAPPGTSA